MFLHAHKVHTTKGTTMKAIASILLITLSVFGFAAPASASASQSRAVATVQHVQQDVQEDTTDPEVAPSSLRWDEAVLQWAGIELPSNVIIALINENNCGAKLSTVGLGGCTYPATATDPRIVITVSPELQYTRVGEHILLHEVGHALGIMEECGAEEFAHQWSDPNYWAYAECAPTTAAPILDAPQATAAPTAPVYIPAENNVPLPTMEPTVEREQAVKAVEQQPTAPATQPTQPVVEQPTVQPTAPTVQPTPPAPTVPSIPPLTDACSEFEARAEDGSCVPSNYWDDQPTAPIIPPHAEPNPSLDPNHPIDCNNLQPGDAFAGIGLYCKLDQKK